MTPAEKPRVNPMNLGPGLLTISPSRLPIVVESPAPAARRNAIHICLFLFCREETKVKLSAHI
jgi:hypothetical protein